MAPRAHLFEQLLLEEDIASVEVCEGVVWVQFGCSLVVIHCTHNISHELVDDSPVGVQHSTGRDLDWNQMCSTEWSQNGMDWKQMEWKCGMKFNWDKTEWQQMQQCGMEVVQNEVETSKM